MTERPLTFSAPMVRALLDGRKVQDRRILKPQPPAPPPANCHPFHQPRHATPYLDAYCGERRTEQNPRGMSRDWHWWQVDDRPGHIACRAPCVPGDRLWVREVFAYGWPVEGNHQLPECNQEHAITYRAEGNQPFGGGRWHSPIHMPRWASRLTLTVTDVRVQRLQDISAADAIAEGCHVYASSATIDCDTPDPRQEYRRLWNDLHGPDAWAANPWVAALTFTVHRQNIDQLNKGATK